VAVHEEGVRLDQGGHQVAEEEGHRQGEIDQRGVDQHPFEHLAVEPAEPSPG
jgi:hypothetical protein